MKYALTLFFLISIACTQFVKMTDSDYYVQEFDAEASDLQVYFSHNINGETHPCGCRKFPLGGLPQVYGQLKSNDPKKPFLYVDSGDTFFPLPFVPKGLERSTRYTALKLAEAMDEVGLNYFTPGDQDFALGEDFLVEIANKHKFKFLISNASQKNKIPHLKRGVIKVQKMTYYFIGITDPSLVAPTYFELFDAPETSIKTQLAAIAKESGPKKIILLSHSGIDQDKRWAKKFPEINWIIGAHTQSYLYEPVSVNKTQIVQTLSRNHFVGQITLPIRSEVQDSYQLLEMRDEKKDLVKNNKMIPWLISYKSELEKIQESEQNAVVISPEHKYLPTFISCSECHTEQVKFWQKTSHSLAFKTLIDAKAAQNQTCIECHSVGYKNPKGFISTKKIIISDKQNFDIDQYWQEFNQAINLNGKSLRSLSDNDRKKLSQVHAKINKKHDITQNFAHVQCLNCHNQSSEHPFDVENKPLKPDYQAACLKCHTPDQSPEWYHKKGKKIATSVNRKYFQQKLKQVSCPKIEKN